MTDTDVYREDRVHVLEEKCDTCIFRPGNLMHLAPGRVKSMVDACQSDDGGNIPCHKTLELPHQAICRGFWDAYSQEDNTLRMATRLGIVAYVELEGLQ